MFIRVLLPEPESADDGDKFTGVDMDTNAAQGVNGLGAHFIIFGDVGEGDHSIACWLIG